MRNIVLQLKINWSSSSDSKTKGTDKAKKYFTIYEVKQ